jgi:hypothetical protein
MKVFLAHRATEETSALANPCGDSIFFQRTQNESIDGNWNAICKGRAANISHCAADSNRPVTDCMQHVRVWFNPGLKRILSRTIPTWPADSHSRI